MISPWRIGLFLLILFIPDRSGAQPKMPDTSYGDSLVQAYFADQVWQIQSKWLEGIEDLSDWEAERPRRLLELREMLGLDPLPPRTDLEATVTGRIEHEEFTVEKLHFQSMPGLYVTANLYVPKGAEGPLPGVLYVCGHANRHEDGVSLGAKTAYQRHAAWYARHGYVALIIDTIQLAEIEGVHHGTHNLERWWWWNRGYTPAGVEVWNGMRALDYLASRPEVDPERLAVTGRSGGGAYSWFLAALDDRVKTTVPTAGITDLEDYVVDGIVTGHCDCMFMINSARWDFPMLAALLAPRPVLLANGDHDPIFPLDGVMRVFEKVRPVYALHDRLGIWRHLIVEAGHDDTHPLQQGTYRWMHHYLKGRRLTADDPAETLFDPAELKVFDTLPEDEINTRIDEIFVPAAPEPEVPETRGAWERLREEWVAQLREKTFAGWPAAAPLEVEQAYTTTLAEGLRLSAYDFDSQPPYRQRLWVLQREGAEPQSVRLAVADSAAWQDWLAVLQAAVGPSEARVHIGKGAEATAWPDADPAGLASLRERLGDGQTALAVFAPRGIGPTAWTESRRGYGVRRGFMLLGQTRDGMRVWDVRRAVQALRTLPAYRAADLRLEGEGPMAGVALYAALFEPDVAELTLHRLPATHREGPILLNVRKIFDLPQALALVLADGREVTLHGARPEDWAWPRRLGEDVLGDEAGLHFASSIFLMIAKDVRP